MKPVYHMRCGCMQHAHQRAAQPQRANKTRHIHTRLHNKHTLLPGFSVVVLYQRTFTALTTSPDTPPKKKLPLFMLHLLTADLLLWQSPCFTVLDFVPSSDLEGNSIFLRNFNIYSMSLRDKRKLWKRCHHTKINTLGLIKISILIMTKFIEV